MGNSGKNRFFALLAGVAGIFLVLLLRLWNLQVIEGPRYRTQSEDNHIRMVPISPARGPVFDRNGELLVENRPSFNLMVLPREIGERGTLFRRLSALAGRDPEALEKNWEKGKRQPRYLPLALAEDVGWERMELLAENAVDLPGVFIEAKPVRSYPFGDMAAHVLGYMGQIAEEELQKNDYEGYRSGDFIGKSGLERALESHLRGEPGNHLIEVDVKGKQLRILRTKEPKPGRQVYLTLDRNLQQTLEEAMGDQAGGAVVIKVNSGEVLAMASSPRFNPARFAQGISAAEWQQLLEDHRHPLSNKVIQGQYPPGSTFKIVTALAALEAGMVKADRAVFCPGQIHIGNRRFRCWRRGGHGWTDLRKALKESCDVWFYQVGFETGIDRISAMSLALGLGQPTGIDLAGEKKGLIPTREWKRRAFKENWFDGETVNASIGQGFVLTTPMQLAVMMAAVANGGTVYRPFLVSRIEDPTGEVVFENKPTATRQNDLQEENLRMMREALSAVVNEQRGTAWRSRLEGLRMAGKTGTSQVVKLKEKILSHKEDEIPYRFRDHALFVAFAPAEKPEIAMAVVVEHGQHGSSAAAPVCQAVFAHYFGVRPAGGHEGTVFEGD
ncbi:MAG: penicillin-binding protein 2 [Deltaproteobacteria bacterium]|nr:penicillin-binding protein 2 [Deltaproteobacteria bacterium]